MPKIGSIILLSAFLVMALSKGFLDDEHAHPAEYFAILQFCSFTVTVFYILVLYSFLVLNCRKKSKKWLCMEVGSSHFFQ